jgi:hypothetical protein
MNIEIIAMNVEIIAKGILNVAYFYHLIRFMAYGETNDGIWAGLFLGVMILSK